MGFRFGFGVRPSQALGSRLDVGPSSAVPSAGHVKLSSLRHMDVARTQRDGCLTGFAVLFWHADLVTGLKRYIGSSASLSDSDYTVAGLRLS